MCLKLLWLASFRTNAVELLLSLAEWSRYRIVAGLVTSSSPVPLKTRRSDARSICRELKRSSRWCGMVVRRGGCQLRCHLTMAQNDVAQSPRAAEQCAC
ncbi:hypothetical protein TNCV_731401 [Trichonephila clavipes]|nr:hypothetical protein TNCV_731401 [Trichonephila clavipes]